jgi:hypothetical protein
MNNNDDDTLKDLQRLSQELEKADERVAPIRIEDPTASVMSGLGDSSMIVSQLSWKKNPDPRKPGKL